MRLVTIQIAIVMRKTLPNGDFIPFHSSSLELSSKIMFS